MQGIRFRKRSNSFLGNLKKEIRKISTQKSLIISADKTTNNYLVPPDKYRNLVNKEIHKSYKKENVKNVGKLSLEHMHTATELELEDRIFNTTPREAFVTLKDHKPDFQIRPSVRLINPTKQELGKIAMQMLDDVVKQIRNKTKLKQCTNTREVISWFESVKNEGKLKFILFDIVAFYPSITPALLNRALEWAKKYVNSS